MIPIEPTLVVGDRLLETQQELRKRLSLGEVAIASLVKRGMPKPIKLGRTRYFDREAVNAFLTGGDKP
jgi:hypothetical protein